MVQTPDPLREMQARWDGGDRQLDNDELWKIQWQEMAVHRRDPLRTVPQTMKEVVANGKLVLAFIVQANETLYAPGANWAPGRAVFQKVTFAASQPEKLAKAAERLFEMADWAPTDPAVAPLIRYLSDEKSRPPYMPVPASALGAPDFVFCSFVIIRRHLPGSYIRKPWLPLIIAPKHSPFPLVPPGELWTPALLRQWISR